VAEAGVAARVVDRARRIADEILFPAAPLVDAADRVPASHLDLLADEGFYGLAGPPEHSGLGIADKAVITQVVEALAGGCLTTTFVWIQHSGALQAAANSTSPGVREEWLEPLCRGNRRAGIALAGVRPGLASVRARAVPGGYVIDGEAPWVTGWGMIDALYLAARQDDGETVIWALLDAVESESLTIQPLDLVAAAASRTVQVRFCDHFVPTHRVTGTSPYREWAARDAAGLRMNGSLGLGLINRCCRLIGPSSLDDELVACRTALDAATPVELPVARAAAAELAMRAATTLAVTAGSRSVLRGEHPQRLIREAAFLLVFGSRPAIRAALLDRLRAAPTP
jgi:alkylation response protein AidB-like acyl-CoA dehydrogenase